MNQQLTILDSDEGQLLAIQGLNRAVDKADRDYTDWSDRCWNLFLKWLSKKPTGYHFQIESFRDDCMKWGKIEEPQSNRAFGMVSRRASSKEYRLIISVGKAKTKSVKSHSANSEVWCKI